MFHCQSLSFQRFTELPERERERLFTEHSYCLSKSLVNELPPPWSPNRAAMERDALVPEPVVYSFIHISQESSVNRLSHETGKISGRCPWSPMGTNGLCIMWCSLIPQRDHLWHCYYYRSVMQSSARYLPPWFGSTRALLASVYCNCLQDIPTTPFTAYYMTQGMDLHVTIRYRRGVRFMGGRYVVSYQGRLNP
jgi:hypothetical protein